MNAIPSTMRNLPVYCTETDQDVEWLNRNIGWVQQAYGEIDFWNKQAGNQQIRALILYRWPNIDKWVIEGKQGVIDDFRQALRFDYRWRDSSPPPPPPPSNGIAVGGRVRTVDVVRMRRSPGFRNKPANDTVVGIAQGTEGTVLGGPSQADGLTWWQVRTINGQEGWMAERTGNTQLLEAISVPPQQTGKFAIGDTIRTADVVRMRRSPGFRNKPANDTVAGIAQGTAGTILGNPSEADGLTWWLVRTTDPNGRQVEGWMAEAVGDNILLETVAETDGGGTPGGSDDDDDGTRGPANGRFKIGDAAVALTVVRMRRTPGFANKPAGDVVLDIPANANLTITDGPQSVDGLTWWQVRLVNAGRAVSGWAAEATGSGVDLLGPSNVAPEPPPQGQFNVGDTVRTLDIVRMRRSPGFIDQPPSDVIADIPADRQGTVLGGPREDDNLIWWNIETTTGSGQTMRGWMAEAVNGIPLLAAASGGGVTPPTTEPDFRPGDLVVTQLDLRVRQSAGFVNKPSDDILGAYPNRFTLNIIDGPRQADNLDWWRVGGITLTRGEVLGWVAQVAANGPVLIDRAAKLPGTNIPDAANNGFLAPPVPRPFGTAQLFGENPQFYARFVVGGTRLRGHNGVDFLTPVGTPIVADFDGTVIVPAPDPNGFGNWLLIQHSWGQSIYAHLDRIDVNHGQSVRQRQNIGTTGNTGASTGPHLHYAIRVNPFNAGDGWGGFIDPLPYMPRDFVILPDYVLPAPTRDLDPNLPAARSAPAPRERMAPSGITADIPENI